MHIRDVADLFHADLRQFPVPAFTKFDQTGDTRKFQTKQNERNDQTQVHGLSTKSKFVLPILTNIWSRKFQYCPVFL